MTINGKQITADKSYVTFEMQIFQEWIILFQDIISISIKMNTNLQNYLKDKDKLCFGFIIVLQRLIQANIVFHGIKNDYNPQIRPLEENQKLQQPDRVLKSRECIQPATLYLQSHMQAYQLTPTALTKLNQESLTVDDNSENVIYKFAIHMGFISWSKVGTQIVLVNARNSLLAWICQEEELASKSHKISKFDCFEGVDRLIVNDVNNFEGRRSNCSATIQSSTGQNLPPYKSRIRTEKERRHRQLP